MAEQYPEDWNTWPADNQVSGSLHPQEEEGKNISASFGLTWNVLVVWENETFVSCNQHILHYCLQLKPA